MAQYDFRSDDFVLQDTQCQYGLAAGQQKANAFTAIVLAGSRHPNDPVAAIFGEQYKALVPICGKPMISRVVDALCMSRSVKKIVIVFDCTDSLFNSCPEFSCTNSKKQITVMPCSSSISFSVRDALETSGASWPYLVTTADHALLTPEMVDSFCAAASDGHDMAVGLVEKKYIEAAHPTSKRTYLPFRGSKLSGANLFAFMSPQALPAINFWSTIERERKRPWRIFSAFGWRNLLGLMLKLYTVDQAFARASSRIGVKAKAVRLTYAEAAIDVDSQKDYLQAEEILLARREALLVTVSPAE